MNANNKFMQERKNTQILSPTFSFSFLVGLVLLLPFFALAADIGCRLSARLDAHEKSEQIVFGYVNERFTASKKNYDEVIKRIDNLSTKLDEILKMMVKAHN